MKVLKIPQERESKLDQEKIEQLLKVELEVTEGNEVTIEGEDLLEEIRAYNIVKAIGRGFSFNDALKLLEDNSSVCIINVSDYASTGNSKVRLKGRVIGREGKAKRKIEEDTNTKICVYGKTVSIIGKVQNVEIAKKTVELLLEGRSHSSAFNWMQKNFAKIADDNDL